MGNINRTFALILIGVIAFSSLSLLSVKPANAQTTSAPLFSISTSNSTRTIPTTYTTDPYTGANVTKIGFTVTSFSIVVTIQNSPQVTAYLLGIKGHYSSQWEVPWVDQYNVTAFASSGSQTVITFQGDNKTSGQANQIFLQYGGNWGINVPFGSLLDFQLQGVSGETPMRTLTGYEVLGDVSHWSAIQTVTVPEPSAAPSPTPTCTPIISPSPAPTFATTTNIVGTAPENPATPIITVAVIVIIALLVVTILLLYKRQKHRKTANVT